MNEAFRDIFLSQIKHMINRSNSIRKINHSGMEGDLRELFVHDLLIPLLPPGFEIGRGKVISSYQEISNQIDCVIYNKNILPPALSSGSSGVFPVESTIMTVEVKTKLTAAELKKTHAAAAILNRFKHSPSMEESKNHNIEHLIPCIFAYDTDLVINGKSEIDRYDEIRGSEKPSIKIICVVGRGFWFWSNVGWITWKFDFEHGEVAGFIASVANVCERISRTRRRPDFRAYIGWNQSPIVTVAQLVQG